LPQPPNRNPEIYLGGQAGGAPGLEGRLDEIAIYSGTVPASDISARYRIVQAAGLR
jgi:hypothetical protein